MKKNNYRDNSDWRYKDEPILLKKGQRECDSESENEENVDQDDNRNNDNQNQRPRRIRRQNQNEEFRNTYTISELHEY